MDEQNQQHIANLNIRGEAQPHGSYTPVVLDMKVYIHTYTPLQFVWLQGYFTHAILAAATVDGAVPAPNLFFVHISVTRTRT